MKTIMIIGLNLSTGQVAFADANCLLSTAGVVGMGSLPTVVINTAVSGSGSSCSVVGTNKCGKITLITGLSLGTGKLLTLNFSDNLSYPTGVFVTITSADANTTGILSKLYIVAGTFSFDLYGSLALGISTTYNIFYHVEGY